jgi:hypothetical protein
MPNMDTKKVINSQEIIWMNQVYKGWKDQRLKKYELDDEDDAVEPKIPLLESYLTMQTMHSTV